jgi:membrane associated rhomboid family serine protease
MGIYDRDYYRRQGPRYLDALGLSGSACKWLIIVNVGIYVLQIATRGVFIGSGMGRGQEFGLVTDLFLLKPNEVLHGQVWRLLTYAFLHEPPPIWQHIVFNMLFLWWFGSDVEQIYGTREFLAMYLLAAFAGGCAYTTWAFLDNDWRPCLGASGAVTAVMVVFACHYPMRMILVFFIFPVPVWLFVGFQVAQDTFLFLGGIKTGTAVTVHLAGAALGFTYYKTQFRLTNLLPNWRAWRLPRARPRLRVVRQDGEVAEAVAVAAPPAATIDEQLEAKLDAVLEKVARSGKDSLTQSEREILLRASEIYKRRRT